MLIKPNQTPKNEAKLRLNLAFALMPVFFRYRCELRSLNGTEPTVSLDYPRGFLMSALNYFAARPDIHNLY